MALTRQCELAGVARSTVYAPHFVAVPDETELLLLALIDAEYTRHPFYGSRKMVVHLATKGHPVNRKRVQRLMGVLGLAGTAPGPNASRPHPQHNGLLGSSLHYLILSYNLRMARKSRIHNSGAYYHVILR